jgi:hypothetical protein
MSHSKWFLLSLFLILVSLVIAQPVLTESIGELPENLEDYSASWQDAVSELESRGVIAEGGQLIFEEDRAFFTGQGNFFTRLASNQPRADFVMAGELTFTTSGSDEYESCALLSRVVMHPTENLADRYLVVGLNNENQAFYIDRYGNRSEDYYSAMFRQRVDLSEPHHILFLAVDDTVTVYFDGKLLVENETIDDRSGSYGVGLSGNGSTASCEGKNIWVYEVPVVRPGVCEITSNGTVNRRSGPGANYEWAGTLTSETVLEAVAQTTGTDGFTWWQLEDESWVRDDIVNTRGACRTLPEASDIQAEETAEATETSTVVGNAVAAETQGSGSTETQVDVENVGQTLSDRVEQLNSGDFNCTVRTDQPDFASVRVGPGSNRTAILFLPAARDFRVLGQATSTVDNGQLWWKLDKEEVSSRTSAAELWVAQNQVEATGDCELVPFVEAPPIIQIIATSDVLPESGTWMMDAGTIIVTCSSNIAAYTPDSPPYSVNITVAAGGDVLLINNDRLQRTQPGVYVGRYSTAIEGEMLYQTFTARVVAANQLAVESHSTFQGCDITIYNTIRR